MLVIKEVVVRLGGFKMGKVSQKKSENGSFEENLEELEGILEALEGSKLPLSDLIAKYERAKICLEECRKRLSAAEMSIKKLNQAGDAFEDFQ